MESNRTIAEAILLNFDWPLDRNPELVLGIAQVRATLALVEHLERIAAALTDDQTGSSITNLIRMGSF